MYKRKELLIRFIKTSNRYIKLSSLREIFQLEKKKYTRFADLRKWVIEPSIREINEKTKWEVSWVPVKTGKRITSVSFSFTELIPKENHRCPHTYEMFKDF